jgi:hypothetical protein
VRCLQPSSRGGAHRLTPGGVYLQWFYTNGLPSDPAEPTAPALRTFASVFPAVVSSVRPGFELLISA